MRQYVPPKCMVRRLRSVRQVQLAGSLRKARILDSSFGVMKSGWRVKPGTDVSRDPRCVDMWLIESSSAILFGSRDTTCFATGRKKSLMSLRFVAGERKFERVFSMTQAGVYLLVSILVDSFRGHARSMWQFKQSIPTAEFLVARVARRKTPKHDIVFSVCKTLSISWRKILFTPPPDRCLSTPINLSILL